MGKLGRGCQADAHRWPTFISRFGEGFLEEALMKLRSVSVAESPVSQEGLQSQRNLSNYQHSGLKSS